MKRLLIFAILGAALPCCAQEGEGNLFSTVRPDVMVIVRQHNDTTADYVQITVLAKNYPPALLKGQIDKIGEYLHTSARGIQFTKPQLETKAQVSFLRADFATDGLIDRTKGIVRLEPIVKAFVGAPEPYTVKGMKIVFEGERTTKNMFKHYPLPGVLEVEGRASAMPAGIEYQVKLIGQDPEQVKIPEEYSPRTNQPPSKEPSSSPNTGLLIGLFLLVGLGLGALVYLALLKAGGARRGS